MYYYTIKTKDAKQEIKKLRVCARSHDYITDTENAGLM